MAFSLTLRDPTTRATKRRLPTVETATVNGSSAAMRTRLWLRTFGRGPTSARTVSCARLADTVGAAPTNLQDPDLDGRVHLVDALRRTLGTIGQPPNACA
jgi:hypothetical protein